MKSPKLIVPEVTIHHNGIVQLLLGPKPLDSAKWGSTDNPNLRRDAVFLGVGSPVRLFEHVYDLDETQELTPSNLALILAPVSTPHDLGGLVRRVAKRDEEIRTGRGFLLRREVHHPNSALVRPAVLGRGAYQGNGSDQKLAVERLQTDTLLKRHLDSLSRNGFQDLAMHRLAGYTEVSVRGFGGTDPWAEYLSRTLASLMKRNMQLGLWLLPSHDEILNRQNAKGNLYNMVLLPVPKDKLICVKAQDHKGAHKNDPAVMMGLVAITGNSYDGSNPDSASLFRTLRECSDGWVEVKSAVADVPLAHLSSRVGPFPRKHHQIRPPEEESPGLRIILTEVHSLLSLNPNAVHILVVAGWWNEGETEAVREAIISMCNPGHAVPVIAHLWPKVTGNVAHYLICDFVAAPQLPTSVTSVFEEPGMVISREGLTRHQFLSKFKAPEEHKDVKEIEEILNRLCRSPV